MFNSGHYFNHDKRNNLIVKEKEKNWNNRLQKRVIEMINRNKDFFNPY